MLVPAGRWKISGLVLPSRVQLVGEGVSVTVLKQAAQSATPIIATEGFATDTGTENLGQTAFAIRDMTLEGTTQSNGLANPYGGVALYGYDYELARLHIIDFNSNGLWTEWGGKLDGGNLYKKQPASFTDLTFSKNWRCGWIHLGPHDSLAARINSFGNGREHTAGGASMNNTGESNIWIARRIGPVAYVEKKVTGAIATYRLSTPGSGYTPGVFAVVKAGNNIGLLGHVIVSDDADQKAIGVNWIYKNSNFESNVTVDVGFLGDPGKDGALPVAAAYVSSRKISTVNFSDIPGYDNLSPGSKLPSWPKITIKNNGVNPPVNGTSALVIPVLRGGQIHAAIVLNSGTGYTGEVTCEVVQGSNTSALGVVKVESGRVTEVLFGDPGCLMNRPGKVPPDKVTVKTIVGANTFTAVSSSFGRFGEVTGWTFTPPAFEVPHAARMDYVPAETSVKKMSPMGGGMLLDQSHAWGAQTYGIRVSATAVLTGCEAEGHYGANMFLEANTGIVTGAWIYDSGDKRKGPGGDWGTGSNSAVGIQIGHAGTGDIFYTAPGDGNYANSHNSPSQWQISGRIENCHAGGVVNFASGDAIQTDLVINNRCGIFHYGFTKLAVVGTDANPPYALDDAISNISPDFDDLRIAAFFGEANFYRYKRSGRASISTSRFQQTGFTADWTMKLDQSTSRLQFLSGGINLFEVTKNNAPDGVKFIAWDTTLEVNRGVFMNQSGTGFLGADALQFRNYAILTGPKVFTAADFVGHARYVGTTTAIVTLPKPSTLPQFTLFRIYNANDPASDIPVTLKATDGTICAAASKDVPAGESLELISNATGQDWMLF